MKKYIFLFSAIFFINLIAEDERPRLEHASSSLDIHVTGVVVSEKTRTANEGKILTSEEPAIIITDKNGTEISVIRFENESSPVNNNLNFDIYTKAVWLNNLNYKEKSNFNFQNNTLALSHVENNTNNLTTSLSVTTDSFHKEKGVLNKVSGSIIGDSVEGLYTAPFSNLNITYTKSGTKITH